MSISVDTTGSLEGFRNCLVEASKSSGVKSLLILACDKNKFQECLDTINPLLEEHSLPLFGGIFPQIILGNEKLSKGTIVAGLSYECDIHILENLSDPKIDFDTFLDDQIVSVKDKNTMFVLFDGYSSRFNDLIDSLFSLFGLALNYIGGGAGSVSGATLDPTPRPCLFTNRGVIKDSALLVLSKAQCGVGVSHGWEKLDGPYKVTGSEGNLVTTIDWQPAFEVYQKIIKSHSGKDITNRNFFSIAKEFPFGLSRLSNEYIVRDPFAVQGEALRFGIPIPEETFIDILHGNVDSLLNGSAKALAAAKSTTMTPHACLKIFFDCISRVLFLGKQIESEINIVAGESNCPQIGAFTLGEIANTGKEYLEYYNKTSVVGLLEN